MAGRPARPRLRHVNPWLVAGVAAVCGLVVGAAIAMVVGGARRRAREREAALAAPLVSPQVTAAMDVLRSSAMLVGPHDQVLHSSPLAHATGIARGTRVGVAVLLDMVREARRTGCNIVREFDIPRGVGIPALPASARIANLGGGSLLVLVDDLSPERRIDASRRDFVANVSHELKTPIGAISVLAEAIEVAADDPDQVVHFASRMQFEAKRLAELVTQIIDLSRLQADDPLLNENPVDASDVAQDAIARHVERASARRVTIMTNLAADCVVRGDRWQLTDAVSNLIANAIAYSDEGARVAVSTRRVRESDDEFVEFSVADNGIGIKPEDQERVFERFFRVDYGRSRNSGGTGLGLSIVRHIAAAHGGNVSLWSRPGHGSTFTMRLPAALSAGNDQEDQA